MLVNVYLLVFDGGKPAFYGEPEPSADAAAKPSRWASVMERFRPGPVEERKGIIGFLVRVLAWLMRWVSPDEPFLRQLRSASHIRVHHPTWMNGAVARRHWARYLRRRRRRHTIWFVLNAMVSPLTILLALLPGPNVFGYWFVYRAACHGLAWLGVRRGLRCLDQTAFEELAVLDNLPGATDDAGLDALSNGLNLKCLNDFLRRPVVEHDLEDPSLAPEGTTCGSSG